MVLIAYAEIDLIGMIILLLFFLNQRRSGCFALDDRIFNSVLLIGSIVLFLDGVLWLLDGVIYPGGKEIFFFLTSASFIINPSIACLWVFYCDLRVYNDERGLRRRAPLYCFPLILNVALVIVNCFSPMAFSIDEANHYHRESLFLIYFIVFYVYLVGAIVLLMRKWKHYESPAERHDMIYMMLFSVPPILGGIVQGLIYGTSFMLPCTIISFVVVYINVLSRQISTDALTGLNNRRMLKRYLDMETTSADANSSLFLIMLDMDNFKQINDTYGHAAGDRALTQIADILKSLCDPRSCFLSRLGGDEFTIVGKDQDSQVLESLLAGIEESVASFNISSAEPYQLSVSAGIARFKQKHTDTTDTLLIAADRSMYRVKADKKQASQPVA